MNTQDQFVRNLEALIHDKLSSLDLLKDSRAASAWRSEIVRRLKMALKNELEASELAAAWVSSTPEIEVKLALARQAGDEAKHYGLIQSRLGDMGVDLSGFEPQAEGHCPMFQLLAGFQSTVERVGAAQWARESLALKKNEQFIEFCETSGDHETAKMYREQIQPDEQWHVHFGRQVLEKYANTPELQSRAQEAVEAVLDLAVRVQNKQLKEMKVSHAPGC